MNTTAEFSSFPEHSTSNSSSLEWEGRQALFGSCLKRDSYGNCCPPVVNALAWLALLAGIALATFFLRNAIIANIAGRMFGRALPSEDTSLSGASRWIVEEALAAFPEVQLSLEDVNSWVEAFVEAASNPREEVEVASIESQAEE